MTSKYLETLDMLYALMPDFQQVGADAYKPGLDRIREFERRLGNPSGGFLCIHVAGTNGKGSVSHMLASTLTAAGYRTGLYTSPHITDFRERIRVDGEMIPEREVVEFADRQLPAMRELGLSFFEATVGMAFEWFWRSGVEVAVVETGLGGRLDATNIITPVVSVITNIGLEHTSFLGDTLAAIAGEKAGIIKPGVPVVVGEHQDGTDEVFRRAAENADSTLVFAQDVFSVSGVAETEPGRPVYSVTGPEGQACELRLDLAGDYQRHNIVTALAALRVMNDDTPLNISPQAIREGLASAASATGLRGRWQVLATKPLVVCDTGHNAHGIKEVVRQIARQKYGKLYMVLGVADDKDLSSILPLLPKQAHYIFTQASVRRAMPAATLAAEAARHGLDGETAASVKQAVERARALASADDMIFIGGSTFVVADAQ